MNSIKIVVVLTAVLIPIVVQCAVVSLPFAIDDFEDHPIDDGRTPLDKLSQRKPHRVPEYGIKHSSRELVHEFQTTKQGRDQSYNHQTTPKVRDQSHSHQQAAKQGRDHSYNYQATQPESYPSHDNHETAQEIPPYHDEEPTKVKPTYSAPASSSYSAPISQPIGSSEGYFKGFVSQPIVLKDDASFEARFPFPSFPQVTFPFEGPFQ